MIYSLTEIEWARVRAWVQEQRPAPTERDLVPSFLYRLAAAAKGIASLRYRGHAVSHQIAREALKYARPEQG